MAAEAALEREEEVGRGDRTSSPSLSAQAELGVDTASGDAMRLAREEGMMYDMYVLRSYQ